MLKQVFTNLDHLNVLYFFFISNSESALRKYSIKKKDIRFDASSFLNNNNKSKLQF